MLELTPAEDTILTVDVAVLPLLRTMIAFGIATVATTLVGVEVATSMVQTETQVAEARGSLEIETCATEELEAGPRTGRVEGVLVGLLPPAASVAVSKVLLLPAQRGGLALLTLRESRTVLQTLSMTED